MANLQGSSASLQGGTGINVAGSNPQQTSSINIQSPGDTAILQGQQQVSSANAYNNTATQQNSDLTAQVNKLLAQLNAQQAAYAPPLDLNSIYSSAEKSAAQAVNPYYSKQLKDFVAQQAADKITQQQQTQTNIQNLQNELTNTLQGNAISGARTSQDVLTNEQQIGQQADQTQAEQGTQFDQARIAQAKQLASEGLTTSGLGTQQVLQSQTDRNTQEAQQADQNKQQVDAQELFKSRTLEDLGRSSQLAQQTETTGEKQANFDLGNYISQQSRDLKSEKSTLEQQRLDKVSSKASEIADQKINKFIQSIADPAQRQAAVQAYAGAF